MKTLRGLYRFVGFALGTTYFVLRLVILTAIKGFSMDIATRHPSEWAKAMLKWLSVEVELQGELPKQQVLVLPNHRSYLDGAIMSSLLPSVFVVKAEVLKWPLIGAGLRGTNTITVDRNNKDSRIETRDKVKDRLSQGLSVTIFPEGTTYEGPGIVDLKPSMFYIAADGNIPVVPVAIEYENTADAWIGKDTFLPHFISCFGKHRTKVKVRIGPIIQETDGGVLGKEVESWINSNVLDLWREFGKPLPDKTKVEEPAYSM